MKTFLKRTVPCVLAFALQAQAAQLDTTADAVLGQPDFTTNASGHSATTLNAAYNLGTDPGSGRLFVADTNNNRVLSWPSSAAFTNGQAADLVLGQADFTANTSACSATGMNAPAGIAVDEFGNVYVSERGNHRIVTFKPPLSSGMAASGIVGQSDFGSCLENRGLAAPDVDGLRAPNGIALSATGYLYVADTGNHRALRFEAGAALPPQIYSATAFVSYGEWRYAPGTFPPNASTLLSPVAVAVDPTGQVWVSDSADNRVLRYPPNVDRAAANLVLGRADFATTTAPATINASSLNNPAGLVFDASGTVYVVDPVRCRILRFSPPFSNGMAASAVLGQSGSFTASDCASTTADSLGTSGGIALDSSGNLLVADNGNHRVLRFDLPLANVAPTLDSISPASAPAGTDAFVLTVNGTGFFAGSTVNWNGSPRTTQIISDRRLLAQIPASDVVSGGPFAVTVSTPAPGGGTSISRDASLYARAPLDASADRVLGQPDFTSDANGPQVGEEQIGGVTAATMSRKLWAAVDPTSGRLFVSDNLNSRILSWPNVASFTNASSPDVIIGQPDEHSTGCNTGGISARSLCEPLRPAVDASGGLFVPDSANNRVLQYDAPFSTGMQATRVFGQAGSFADNTCSKGGRSANSLCRPLGVAVSDSRLFVSDASNFRILVYDNPYADFTADAVIGQENFTSGQGPPVSATSVGEVYGLASDREGRLVVADWERHRVLRFSPPFTNNMAADLVIGQPDFVSFAYPNVSAGTLNSPIGVAIDRGGNLLVADGAYARVLRFPAPLATAMAATGVIGQTDFVTATGGTSRTKMFGPSSVALDAVGNLIVADPVNLRVLAFDRPFATPLPKSDTTGNGKSDLVWRASDGGLAVWDMNGGTPAGFFYALVDSGWEVVGTGDFNGDGKADLFWRRSSDGATYVWMMDGTHPVSFVNTGVVPLDYVPVAVADFNGDGYADVMFRRTNGENYLWLMMNGSIVSQGFFASLPVEWSVRGVGDFNGDGKADLVWRNSVTNDAYVWTMNGLTILSSGVLANLGGTWQIQGVADFDGDGKDDIQWRNADGDNFLFEMNGTAGKAYIAQASMAPEWVIQGFGDFNGDGFADIVYRHSTTGEVVIWLMRVNAPTSTPPLGNPGAIWSIVAPKR
jgi:FG-GAP-like repeat/NHL repeat